jgi:zinc transport system substrate-binding protein
MFLRASRLLPTLAVVGALALAGCGSDGSAATGDKLDVVTAFYPLQYATEQVAGEHATVSSLTKPGAEPHDLELTPQDVAKVGEAGLVVYLKGFQPAVDEAVEQEAKDKSLEVGTAADLSRPAVEEEHEGEEAGAHEEELTHDPHFWLDPTRLAKVGTAIADKLAAEDPDNAQAYKDNAAKLTEQLSTLDDEFEQGLATCQNKDLVTSHQAFGYLADRYGLTQVGISGLSPEQEPSPAKLAEVAKFVRDHQVRTIYYETLVSPTIAETVARETNARTAVLDPIEGVTDDSAAKDYPGIMRANLQALEKGQSCS